jgi:hypothetical protein
MKPNKIDFASELKTAVDKRKTKMQQPNLDMEIVEKPKTSKRSSFQDELIKATEARLKRQEDTSENKNEIKPEIIESTSSEPVKKKRGPKVGSKRKPKVISEETSSNIQTRSMTQQNDDDNNLPLKQQKTSTITDSLNNQSDENIFNKKDEIKFSDITQNTISENNENDENDTNYDTALEDEDDNDSDYYDQED